MLKCAPTAIYSGVDIPNNLCESFLVIVQKLLLGKVPHLLFTHFSDFNTFFNSVKWLQHQKYADQIILSLNLIFTNIHGNYNIVGCESFLQSSYPEMLD